MSVNWDNLAKIVLVAVGFLVLSAGAASYVPLIRQNERLRREIYRLDTDIAREEETNKALKNAIDISHTVKSVERAARKHLGYSKTGEIVVRFESPSQPPTLRQN